MLSTQLKLLLLAKQSGWSVAPPTVFPWSVTKEITGLPVPSTPEPSRGTYIWSKLAIEVVA